MINILMNQKPGLTDAKPVWRIQRKAFFTLSELALKLECLQCINPDIAIVALKCFPTVTALKPLNHCTSVSSKRPSQDQGCYLCCT